MAEYIEREAALERLKSSLSFTEKGFDDGLFKSGCIAAIKDDISNIRHLPTADVVEVRHGEWIFEFAFSGHSLYRCSVCGRQESLLTKERTAEYFPYCHCGAKMDGKGEDA